MKTELDKVADNILLALAEEERTRGALSSHLYNLGWGHETLEGYWAIQTRKLIKSIIADALFDRIEVKVDAR